MFYDSVDVSNHIQDDIQQIKSPDWVYNSSNIFTGLFPDNNVLEKQGLARDSSFIYNNGIVTNIDFQNYERRVNTIYLNTVAVNNFAFDEEQIVELAEIAHLCPALGGTAVFKARSLYALVNDTALYNDDGVCLEQGVMYRLSKTNSANEGKVLNTPLTVFPNPTNGKFILKSKFELPLKVQIRILNSLGQVLHNELVEIKGEYEVNALNAKAGGLYFVQVFDYSGRLIFLDKLIKN